MATVPQYEIGQVKDAPVQGGQQQIKTLSEAFGSTIAEANIQRGQALSQLGDQAWQQAFKQRDKQDQAILHDRDNLFSTKIRELISDPDGYLSLTGKSAVEQKEIVEKALEEYRKQLTQGLDQRILGQWNVLADQRINTAFGTIANHSRQQTDEWLRVSREARIENIIMSAGASYNNPEQLAVQLNLGLIEIDQQIRDVYGIDAKNPANENEQAIVDKARMSFTTKAHQQVIDSLLAIDNYRTAALYFEANKGQIDSSFYDEIETSLRSKTRQGETFAETERILDLGLSHTDNLTEARKLIDPALVSSVVQELKTRYQEGETARKKVEADAKTDVLAAIADGVRSRNDIDPDLWNRMSGDDQNYIEGLFQQHADHLDAQLDEERLEAEANAKDFAYETFNKGGEITVEILEKMNPQDAFEFQNTIRTHLKNMGTIKEQEAYEIINDLISQGKTFEQLPEETWNKMSGVMKRTLKAILDTKVEKTEGDLEQEAYETALGYIADGQLVPQDVMDDLNGLHKLLVTNEIEKMISKSETEAYEESLGYLARGEEIPEEILGKLNGLQLLAIEKEKVAAKDRNQVLSYEEALGYIARGEEIPQEVLDQLDGLQLLSIKKEKAGYANTESALALQDLYAHLLIPGNTLENAPEDLLDKVRASDITQIKKTLEAEGRTEEIRVEDEAYQAALEHLLIPGNTLKNLDPNIWDKVSGVHKTQIENSIAQKKKTEGVDAEDAVYQDVLKWLLIDGNSLENLPAGWWDKLNGVHQTSITNAVNDAKAKSTTASTKIIQQKNWMILSDMAVNNYDKFMKEDLQAYVGLVSDTNLSKLLAMQQDKNQSYIQGTRDTHLKSILASLGYNYNDDKKGAASVSDEGDDIRRFIETAENMAQALQAEQGKVTDMDYQKILIQLATDTVWNAKGIDEQEPLIMVDDFEDAYVKVGEEDIYLKDIKDVERAEIMTVLNTHGITTSSQNIGALSTVPADDRTQIVAAMIANKTTVTVRGILEAYHQNK